MYDHTHNITSLLNQAIDLNPEKLALSDNKINRTYKELKFLIKTSSQILLNKFGVLKGDRVVIYSENSVMFIEAFFSILNIGAIAVLIDPNSTNSSLKFLLNNSEAKCAYVSNNLLERFSKCVNNYDLSLRNIITLGSEKIHFEGFNIIIAMHYF